MTEFAFFIGCQIPARLTQYESSARAVLSGLGVRLIDIREFNCCGYPLRNIEFKVFLLSSARNLALAEKRNLHILTLCKCCYGTLKKADHLLKEYPLLKEEVNQILKKEEIVYEGKVEIKHFLTVLLKEIGIEKIKEKIVRNYRGLKIATHYGCHALRPSEIVGFDNAVAPSIFDPLVEATGAESMDWQMKLECCGAPLLGINDELSMDLMLKKLQSGKEAGAEYLCVACPYCHLKFDSLQKRFLSQRGLNHPLPSILYTQLLGLSLGIDQKVLGLEMNEIPITRIEESLITETKLAEGQESAEHKEIKKEKESAR